ncbi:hypothetical protein BKA65DRAFT_558021 [Rhexocercosporidium sp. MPI-PUGE-AT-0058]|nr:hypothetical protein BKA65DRAFT_558021 [Rhexocercosporidium sp. MPI-PUGE-AT-0058]
MEKKCPSRAFMILLISFNVARILGLTNSATTLPDFFVLERCFGFKWIITCQYVLTSVVNAKLLTIITYVVFFGLVEIESQERAISATAFQPYLVLNVVFTLISGAFFDFQLSAFANVWALVLSAPRSRDSEIEANSFQFSFTGGFGIPAATLGPATSFLGIIVMVLQIFHYTPVHAHM